MKTPRLLALGAAASLTLGFAACGGDDDTTDDEVVAEDVEADEDDTIDVEADVDDEADVDTDAADADADADETDDAEVEESDAGALGGAPEWADGATDVGELIGTIETDSWSVDVYQVGLGTTSSDSMFVDPDTNENVLPEGSEVVFVNFVFTNTTDEEIQLGASLGSPSITSMSWPFIQGQPGESRSSGYEALGLSNSGTATGFHSPYTVEPGQTFAQADSIEYVPGDEAIAKVRITPVDDQGDLLHDLREEDEMIVEIS